MCFLEIKTISSTLLDLAKHSILIPLNILWEGALVPKGTLAEEQPRNVMTVCISSDFLLLMKFKKWSVEDLPLWYLKLKKIIIWLFPLTLSQIVTVFLSYKVADKMKLWQNKQTKHISQSINSYNYNFSTLLPFSLYYLSV